MKRAFFILLLLAPSVLQAQRKWSLEDCIAYSREHNLQIQHQELSIEKMENALLLSKISFLPSISAGAQYNTNRDLSQLSGSIDANLLLFNGLARFRTLEKCRLSLSREQQNLKSQIIENGMEITGAYLECLLAKAILDVSKEGYYSILREQSSIDRKVDEGELPYSSMLEISAQVLAEHSFLIKSEGDLATAKLELANLLDLENSNDFDIKEYDIKPDLDFFNPEHYSELGKRADSLPRIRSAALDVEISRKELEEVKSMVSPTLSATASLSSSWNNICTMPFKAQLKSQWLPAVGLTLSIPIFNGLTTVNRIKDAKATQRQYEIQLTRERLEMQKEIALAINSTRVRFDNCIAAREKAASSAEALRVSGKKMEAGLIAVTDYVIAKKNYLEARCEYFQSYYQYVFQLKILDFYRDEEEK